jgi:hypothetical protein
MNRWSFFENAETLKYSFDIANVNSYKELVSEFIKCCEKSAISKLIENKESSLDTDTDARVNNFLVFLEKCRLENNRNLYPRISTTGIYNFGNETLFDYYFDNRIYVYDDLDNIIELIVSHKNLSNQLNVIKHGQKNQNGLALPFEFETYYKMGSDGTVQAYEILIHLYSDIWLDIVPCIHCEKKYSNEEIRANGRLSKVSEFWFDNKELAELNKKKINSFLQKMKNLSERFGGKLSIEEVHLYKGITSDSKLI